MLLLCKFANGRPDHRIHIPNSVDFACSRRWQSWHIHMLYVFNFIDCWTSRFGLHFVFLLHSGGVIKMIPMKFRAFSPFKSRSQFYLRRSEKEFSSILPRKRWHNSLKFSFPVIGVAVYSTWLYGIYRVSSIDLSVIFNVMFAFTQQTLGKRWRAIASLWIMLSVCVCLCLSRFVIVGMQWLPLVTDHDIRHINASVCGFVQTFIHFWISVFLFHCSNMFI